MAKTQNRDVTGKGWEDWSFTYPEGDPNIDASTFGIYPTASGLEAAQQVVMPMSVGGAQQQMGMPGVGVNPATASQPGVMQGAGGGLVGMNTPAADFLSPQEQAPVQEYLSDPEQLRTQGVMDTAKSWLSNLFDYEDKKETGIESVWDGFLRGVDWGYDRLSQLTAAGISGLPGGMRTLTWDEAGEVSVGQAVVGSMGAAAGRMERGEMTAGDWLTLPGVALSTALAQIDTENVAQDADFDITDEAQRKAAFSDSTAGRISSGITDAAFVIFGDPLIFGGKFLKVGRLRYLDRPIETQKDIDRVVDNLDAGRAAVSSQDPAQIARMAPEAQFANWVTQKGENGEKLVTRSEIMNHRVVRYATNRDGIASALNNAENYDEAALIIRAAVGDATAQSDLLRLRADLAIEIGDARRQLNMQRFHMDPTTKAKMTKQAERQVDLALTQHEQTVNSLKARGLSEAELRATPEFQRSKARLDAANETWVFTDSLDESMIDPLNPMNFTADTADAARNAVKQMQARDKYFTKAVETEASGLGPVFGSFRESNAGFSRGNWFGRKAEASRQKRATRAYEAAAVRGARRIDESGKAKRLRPWQKDAFGNNGLTRGLNLWRWFGEETPAGFVTTRSIGGQESTREIRAALNDIPIYSGETKTISRTKMRKNKETDEWEPIKDKDGKDLKETFVVGGVDRKEQLIARYMDALQDTTRGDMAAKMALDRIEEEIMGDIAAWHGLSADTVNQVLSVAKGKRDKIVDSIKREGYWVDESGSINRSPWLETQLQQGTYMLNFKTFEKRARLWDEQGWTKRYDTTKQAVQTGAGAAYEFFNELWRPAVLMRLGYTQRNTFEGLARSTAFQFSLAPLKDAVYQGGFSLRNAWVRRNLGGFSGTKGAIEEATVALREARRTGAAPVLPKKFLKWKASQIVAQEKNMADNIAAIGSIGKELAELSPAAKDELITFFMNKANDAADELAALKNSGAPAKEIEVAQGKFDAMNDQIGALRKVKTDPIANPEVEGLLDQMRFFMQMDEWYASQRALLDSDLEAVALFRQQGTAKRRVFDGELQVTDGQNFQQAFSRNSPYSPIALLNLSADNTQQAMASLRGDAYSSVLRQKQMRYYVNVNPDQGAEYFEGVATSVRQFKNSEVGSMVVNGATPEEVVKFLRNTQEGREIASFVTKAEILPKDGKSLAPVDYESTVAYVDELFKRWEQLAPTAEFREYVRRNSITAEPGGKSGFTGQVVETLIGQKDEAGNFVNNLQPVVGNIAEEVGFLGLRQQWRRLASYGMKWLGTIPEDAFVRVPFYGRRYEESMKGLVRTIQEQTGQEVIPARMIERLQNVSHRRALKDTKDWLYTIERRTRLGRSGEYLFPFISAFQNSTTTIGRLMWRDPSVLGIGLAVWNTPNKIDMEDEEGNIVLALPLNMMPEGLKETFGVDEMLNIKIRKSSLNAIMPETGFGFVPRPGPIGVAPVSEMMKHGWFGMSPEAPEILRGYLGDEGAENVWNVWKSYVFGEGRGLSAEAFSSDLFLPPVAQKLKQMIEGEGSSRQYAYYYNMQYRNEIAQYLGGYRDDMPDANEIRDKTNRFYWTRILGNMLAFTPPQYESNLQPLTDAIRAYDREYGLEGSRMANQAFGNLLMMVGDFSTSKNVAGMQANVDSVRAARKYGDLMRSLAPTLAQTGNMSVLSMLVTDNPNALYDGSAYAWQFSNQIPGVTDYFRELQTPDQAWLESQKNAGWTEYISRMDYLDALLQQRGLSSYRQAGAEDLREMKSATIQEMKNNPLYQGWATDYEEFGSTRTENAVRLMRQALSNPEFVADKQESQIWQAASVYLQGRDQVMAALANSPNTINHSDNQQIRDYWDQFRQDLINQVDGWGSFANRFLNGDDDPANTGVQFATVYEQTPEGSNV